MSPFLIENSLFSQDALRLHLMRLQPDSPPLWGSFTPQHMVEHLAEVIRFSNGKKNIELAIPFEKAERAKSRLLTPEFTMPKDFKAAFMPPEGLPPLQFSSLKAAIDALFSEIDDFYSFFAQNPGATPTHLYFSHLNREEWEVLHHKHILHHFEQFGLIP